MRRLCLAALALALIPGGTAVATSLQAPEFVKVTSAAAEQYYQGLRRDEKAQAGKAVLCGTHNRTTLYRIAAKSQQQAYDEFQLAYLVRHYIGPSPIVKANADVDFRRASRYTRIAAHSLIVFRRCTR